MSDDFQVATESLLMIDNDKLRRQVVVLTQEVETLIGFLLEVKQWGASNCRCSFNAASLLEQLRRGVTTKKDL